MKPKLVPHRVLVETFSVDVGAAEDDTRVEELRTSVVSDRAVDEVDLDEVQVPYPLWHPVPQYELVDPQ